MKFFEKANRLVLLDQLLRDEKTGSLTDLGDKLGISRSQMHNHLKSLREFGFPIVWSSDKNSYIYSHPEIIEVQFPVKFKPIKQ